MLDIINNLNDILHKIYSEPDRMWVQTFVVFLKVD